MQLIRYLDRHGNAAVGLKQQDEITPLSLGEGQYRSLFDLLEADEPASVIDLLADQHARRVPISRTALLAPIEQHEVWAAGVTYLRSRTARMEESDAAADCYQRVYEAARPELFLKATANRVVGSGQPVRVRDDSEWSVPEPELALVLNSRLELVGYTVGNDLSARDIEGENPLYLPQAKVYDGCCALGPWITLVDWMPSLRHIGIRLRVRRGSRTAFEGETSVANMARSFDDLITYLGRDNTFPHGAVLLTGTGIVPPDNFSLAADDVVEISIDGIGTLRNPVVHG